MLYKSMELGIMCNVQRSLGPVNRAQKIAKNLARHCGMVNLETEYASKAKDIKETLIASRVGFWGYAS